MHNDRQPMAPTEFELGGERPTLNVAWRVVVMIVQTGLPNRHDARVVQRGVDARGDLRRPGGGLVGMNARCRRQPEVSREPNGALRGRDGIGYDNDVRDAGFLGTLEDRMTVRVEPRIGQMTVRVDEHCAQLLFGISRTR
jgi:hypothetical protein